jgi:hypothetical protein
MGSYPTGPSQHGERQTQRLSAASVDRKQESMVLAKSDRSLRLERVVDATASTAACVEFADIGKGSVGRTLESDDLIVAGGVRLDEHSSRLI